MSRPWRASGEANSLQQGKLGGAASPTPLIRFYRFVLLRQVQARPTHYNSELSLCYAGGHSYVTSLEVFREGMVWTGAQYPRKDLSKAGNIQEFSVGDTPVGYEITLKPIFTGQEACCIGHSSAAPWRKSFLFCCPRYFQETILNILIYLNLIGVY